MRWSCIPSKNVASTPEPVAPVALDEPVISVDPVASVEPPVKKCSSCKCAPVKCAPVTCAPVRCVPLGCWKSSQPLVLRSTPPPGTEKLTSASDEQPDKTSVNQ